MTRLSAACLAVLATLLMAAEAPLKLDAPTQKRLGVVVTRLDKARGGEELPGFATVLDASPLAALDADLLSAQAAVSASEQEARRTRTLNANDAAVSTRAAQAAQAQWRADAAKLQLLRRRLGLEWGSGFAEMKAERRSAVIADLAAGRAALVRLDTPGGRGLEGRSRVTIILPSGMQATASILGPARAADPRLQSSGRLALVRGNDAPYLSSGLNFPVRLAAEARGDGVLVPRSAVIRAGGASFVYVRLASGEFERRALKGAVPQADGLFVPRGLAVGTPVVTAGAAALYAAQSGGGQEAD